MTDERDRHRAVRIGGDVTGQVIIGNNNFQYWQRIQALGPASAEELAELRAAIATVRTSLSGESEQTADQAAAKLDELEGALTSENVDIPTVEHVEGWFRRKLPKIANMLNKIILGPIVAKLVAAGGDQLVAEFTRRFG